MKGFFVRFMYETLCVCVCVCVCVRVRVCVCVCIRRLHKSTFDPDKIIIHKGKGKKSLPT